MIHGWMIMKTSHLLFAVSAFFTSISISNVALALPAPSGMGSCPPPVHQKVAITGVRVSKAPSNEVSPYLNARYAFYIETRHRVISRNAMSSPDKNLPNTVLDFFFSPAMALSCVNKTTVVNPVVPARTRLTLNRPVIFEGRKIPAGTNLLKIKKQNGARVNGNDIYVPALHPFTMQDARIGKGFKFKKGQYIATFSWKLKRGGRISNRVRFNAR